MNQTFSMTAVNINQLFNMNLLFLINLFYFLIAKIQVIDGDVQSKCKQYYPETNILFINCNNRNLTTVTLSIIGLENDVTIKNNLSELSISLINNNFKLLKQLPIIDAENVYLSFKYCHIENIEEAAFTRIQNIKYLDLSWNLLTGESIHSDIFIGKFNTREYEPLEKLEILDLSHNNIHALSKKSFEHIPNLKSLYLSHNPLKVLGLTTVAAISSTPHLRVLDLSSTNLYHISDDAFALFKELTILKLSNNYLKTVPESLVYASDSLKRLDFSGNAAEELNDDSFLGLKSLTHLNISNMYNLKKIHAGTFQWLEKLNVLYLSNNPLLTYIDKDAFGDLKTKWPIAELYINKNSFQQVSTQLACWEKLVQLDMSDNPWRCDCQLYHTIKKIKAKYRERNQKFPVCYEPSYLSGISLFAMPSKLCEKPMFNGTLNGVIQVLFKDESKKYRTTPGMSRRTKVMWFLIMCAIVVITLTVCVLAIKIYLKAKQKQKTTADDKFKPVKYRNANTTDITNNST